MPDEYTAVIGRAMGGETAPVFGSDGLWHVVYELVLTNARPVPATIETIEILDYYDTERVLRTITSGEIVQAGVNLAGRARLEPEDTGFNDGDAVLQPNESMVVFIELEFESEEEIPNALVHRYSGMAATNPGSRSPSLTAYLLLPKSLSRQIVPTVGAPLKGDGWVAVNGCCQASSAHRGSIQTISGSLFLGQRFAVDWVKIGDNGKFFEGDPSKVTSWYNYGEPVLAVADGIVIEVLDELDDQPPGTLPDPMNISIQTVDGNHVIMDIGDGNYVFYAHLKKGSVAVKAGDEVRMGDQLGELGNSGNTSAPHLHIHFMTSPSALAADGIPYRYAGATLAGQIELTQWDSVSQDLDEVWVVSETTDPQLEVFMPMDLNVINFSEAQGEH